MKARGPQLRAGLARGSERARLVRVLGDGLRARPRLQVPQLHARVAGAGRKRAAIRMARHAQHPRLVTCTGCTPRVFAAHSRVHACSPATPRHETLSMLPAARGWHVAGARPRSQCVSDSPPHAAAPTEGYVTVLSCARRGPGAAGSAAAQRPRASRRPCSRRPRGPRTREGLHQRGVLDVVQVGVHVVARRQYEFGVCARRRASAAPRRRRSAPQSARGDERLGAARLA